MKNKINKFNAEHRKISFQNLLVFVFAILIILVNTLTIIMYSNSYKKLTYNNIILTQETDIQNLIDLVDSKIENQAQITTSISNNERINEIIRDKSTNLLTHINNETDIKNIFLDYSGSLKYIYSVNIFTKNYAEPLNSLMVGDYSEAAAPYAINDYQVFEKYVLNDLIYQYDNGVHLNVFRDSGIGVPILMSLGWVKDESGEQIGVVALLMPFEHAFSVVTDLGKNSDSDFYIIDNDGRSIYDTRENETYNLMEDSIMLNTIIEEIHINESNTIDYDDYIISYSKFATIDWTLIEVTPRAIVLQAYEKERIRLIIISTLVTFVMVIFVFFLTKLILTGLRHLLKNIKTVKTGVLSIESIPSRMAEIDELNTNFKRMTNEIGTLMEEIEVVNKKEKEAELKALQAQINPHFLYNTLDALYWMSNDDDVSSIIHSLGKFFRLSLSKGMDLVTVEDELMQVQSYINIQRRIYEGRFEVVEEIDQDLYSYRILKLILQPLVENAILHGFKEMEKGGLIVIRTKAAQSDIVIEVEDNGKGVDLNQIKEITDGENASSGYGIRNVYERIRLKFGDKYGLTYSHRYGGGTIVTINIPKISD